MEAERRRWEETLDKERARAKEELARVMEEREKDVARIKALAQEEVEKGRADTKGVLEQCMAQIARSKEEEKKRLQAAQEKGDRQRQEHAACQHQAHELLAQERRESLVLVEHVSQCTALLSEAQKENTSVSEAFAASQEEVAQLKQQQQHHHHQQDQAAAEAQSLRGEITCLNDKILAMQQALDQQLAKRLEKLHFQPLEPTQQPCDVVRSQGVPRHSHVTDPLALSRGNVPSFIAGRVKLGAAPRRPRAPLPPPHPLPASCIVPVPGGQREQGGAVAPAGTKGVF